MASIQIEIGEANFFFIMDVCINFEMLKVFFLNCGVENSSKKLPRFTFSIKTLNIGMT
jgi:hypothetical protein